MNAISVSEIPMQSFGAAAASTLAMNIARNVRRLRESRGLSIEELATQSRADGETLKAIEFARGEPSLGLAWRVAHALNVPLGALTADHAPRGTVVMRHDKAQVLISDSQGVTSRPLFPFPLEGRVEFYEVHVSPEHSEYLDPHSAGAHVTLYVAKGRHLSVTVGREPAHTLDTGDSILFPADLEHSICNLSRTPAVVYLLITHRECPEESVEPPANVEPERAVPI